MEYKGQNFQGVSFKGQDLQNVDFSGSDLRGSDFSGANLSNVDFSKSVTGLTMEFSVALFVFALIVSLLSGYIAMLTGETIQILLNDADFNYNLAGYITIVFFVVFIVIAIWKGGIFSFKILIPVFLITLIISSIMKLSELGTGKGALLAALAFFLYVVMIFVGTIARASAGALASNILFLIVALGGGMFGKSLGGGLGTVALAIACAVISKRALKGTKGFEFLYNIALKVSSHFGTSFKNANLSNSNFSNSTIKNTDFSNAKLNGINWENASKLYVLNDKS